MFYSIWEDRIHKGFHKILVQGIPCFSHDAVSLIVVHALLVPFENYNENSSGPLVVEHLSYSPTFPIEVSRLKLRSRRLIKYQEFSSCQLPSHRRDIFSHKLTRLPRQLTRISKDSPQGSIDLVYTSPNRRSRA